MIFKFSSVIDGAELSEDGTECSVTVKDLGGCTTSLDKDEMVQLAHEILSVAAQMKFDAPEDFRGVMPLHDIAVGGRFILDKKEWALLDRSGSNCLCSRIYGNGREHRQIFPKFVMVRLVEGN